MSKLILGTAQFGQPYGIKGDPVPSLKEIEKITQVAWDGGIREIYTYEKYGCDDIINKLFSNFSVIDKKGVYPDWFIWGGKIGLSIYEPKEIFDELTVTPVWDIYQVPVNVLDTRFVKRFKKMKQDGIEIHARSVFLQGLLLMEDQFICGNIHPGLPEWVPKDVDLRIQAFHRACRTMGLKPYKAALGWVMGFDEIDKIIIGVNSAKQLEELLAVKPLKWAYDFSIDDENVLNPRRWPNCKI